MATSYIPSTDAGFDTWLLNIQTLIVASPTTYGLNAGDAVAIAAAYTSYHAAYLLAKDPSTRTPDNVNAKDAAKANAIALARAQAQRVQNTPGVTEMQKTALGITVRKTNKTPIPAPTTSPLLTFVAATPLQHTVRFADQLTPAKKAKPFGALQLSVTVSVAAGSSQNFVATKNPVAVNFLIGDVGKLATYKAQWQTRTGLKGPDSTVISQTVIGS